MTCKRILVYRSVDFFDKVPDKYHDTQTFLDSEFSAKREQELIFVRQLRHVLSGLLILAHCFDFMFFR